MSLEVYVEHLPLRVPPEDVHAMTRFLLQKCPVVHSDVDGGFWLLNRHDDILRVMQDWNGFVNGNAGVRVPNDPPGVNRPPMPPIDWNGPMHRKVRDVMNPYLSPQALKKHEPGFRSIIGGMIEAFAARGSADVSFELAKRFPVYITCQELLGVTDPVDLENLRIWNRRLSYDLLTEEPAVLAAVQRQWTAWSTALVEERKAAPGPDIVSGLIHATLADGTPLLSDVEVVGAIQILVAGGFSTTSEATSNIVVRLIEDPTLESLLRERPELIPAAIEEILRLEPPVNTRPRKCTRDVEIGGRVLREGDRLLVNYLAANIDPDEWDQPEEFIIDRKANRVMTFGAGPHRCIGSTMARLSLQIMVEELLARVTDLRYADDLHERRISTQPGGWRMVESFPITFTPLEPARPLR